jgi:hypothetical protein
MTKGMTSLPTGGQPDRDLPSDSDREVGAHQGPGSPDPLTDDTQDCLRQKSDGKASKGVQRRVFNAIAAVQTWRHQACGGTTSSPPPRTSLREVDVETWDAIRSRRNVRSYSEQAIAPRDLDRILEAARRAPSAGNQQAWDFIVCTDPEQLTQLARVGPAARHVAGSVATIALVAPSSDDAQTHDLVQLDLGQAAMSVMLPPPTWGSAAPMPGLVTRSWRGGCWAFPGTGFVSCWWPSVSPLTVRWRRSSGPTGARSPTSCTAATGSGPHPRVVGAVRAGDGPHPPPAWRARIWAVSPGRP